MKIKTILGEDLKPVIILENLGDLERLSRDLKLEIFEGPLAYYLFSPNYIWKVFKKKEEGLIEVKPYPLKTNTDSTSYEGKWMYDIPVTC